MREDFLKEVLNVKKLWDELCLEQKKIEAEIHDLILEDKDKEEGEAILFFLNVYINNSIERAKTINGILGIGNI